MKYLKYLAFFVLLASAQFAYSDSACDACDPCNVATECDLCNIKACDVEFELYADALYWRVCDNYRFYPNASLNHINPSSNWGWRVGVSAYWNTWDLGLRYTSFSSTDRLVNIGETITHKFDYDVIDLEAGRACCICDGILFRPFVGAKFAKIKVQHDDEVELGFAASLTDQLKGAGLYIGFDNRWQLCSFNVCDRNIPVALVTRLSTGIMDVDFEYYLDNVELGKECQYIPVHELYAGLEFRFCGLCNADAFFQIGYEVQYWGWRRGEGIPVPQALDLSDNGASHLGLGGLVLRFGVNF